MRVRPHVCLLFPCLYTLLSRYWSNCLSVCNFATKANIKIFSTKWYWGVNTWIPTWYWWALPFWWWELVAFLKSFITNNFSKICQKETFWFRIPFLNEQSFKWSTIERLCVLNIKNHMNAHQLLLATNLLYHILLCLFSFLTGSSVEDSHSFKKSNRHWFEALSCKDE